MSLPLQIALRSLFSKRSRYLHSAIGWIAVIGLILGVLLGWLKPDWGIAVRPLSMLFLNLIKSIIAPLLFGTLVYGIAGTGNIRAMGRIGLKAILYFEIVTTAALFLGLAAVSQSHTSCRTCQQTNVS